jgi:hypothetical protein
MMIVKQPVDVYVIWHPPFDLERYLAIQLTTETTPLGAGGLRLEAYFSLDGTAGWLPLPQVMSDSAGYRYYDISGWETADKFRIVQSLQTKDREFVKLVIGDISMWDKLPTPGSGHQQERTLTVGGSARTQGSLAVEHETTALGDVLVATYPETYTAPSLRKWRTAGNAVTIDGTLVSGAREPLAGAAVHYRVLPTAWIPPGPYSVLVRLRDTSPGIAKSLIVQTYTEVDAVRVDGGQNNTTPIAFPDNGWYIISAADLYLPSTTMPNGNGGAMVIELLGSDPALQVDEAWFFPQGDGCALTWVSGAHKRLWLEVANVDHPYDEVWSGDAAADADGVRSNAYAADVLAWGAHSFEPGIMKCFTVTTGVEAAAVSLKHHRRYHTHVVNED